jgi:DNA-damage-inducible protein D
MEQGISVSEQLERFKRVHSNQSEYWMGREIQLVLGYAKWDNFQNVIDKAKNACESSGLERSDHFLDTKKMVPAGSGTEIEREDCFLSRYACYLIAMNGDPTKAEIGTAQTYFAIQTRRQEQFDQLNEEKRRITLRDRVRDHNKQLNDAAKQAGVRSERFGVFHDAGYRGLYEMSYADIKKKKGISISDNLLDYAGRVELAANDFRITQTDQKLKTNNIRNEALAIQTHNDVGKEVRETIKKIGGKLPEDLPTEPHIKKVVGTYRQPKLINE